MKVCTKCNIPQILDNFYLFKKGNIYSAKCKVCVKNYNQSRKDEIKLYDKIYYDKHREERIKFVGNKNKSNNYAYSKTDKALKRTKEYNFKNKDQKNLKQRIRLKTNINAKISANIRTRICWALKNDNSVKKHPSLKLLGCSVEEFKIYIESQFLPEMSWSNHGEVWEIDHKKACAKFDLSIESEQLECFNFKNQEPLFKTTKIAESLGYPNYIGNRDKADN